MRPTRRPGTNAEDEFRHSFDSNLLVLCAYISMARKEPRELLIQPHMYKNDDSTVQLKSCPCSLEGIIQSFVARSPAEDAELR